MTKEKIQTKKVYCFLCKNYAHSFTPVWCKQCKAENYSLYEPKDKLKK